MSDKGETISVETTEVVTEVSNEVDDQGNDVEITTTTETTEIDNDPEPDAGKDSD